MNTTSQNTSIKDFVSFELRKMLETNETLKTLSDRLDLKSPSLLSMVANGKRLPSEALLEKLFVVWKTGAKERKFLRLQLKLEKKHQKGKEALSLMQEIKKLNPPSTFFKLKLKQIESVRDWHVLVVRALANSPEFQADPQWISERLRNKISPKQARTALSLLIDRGLLAQDEKTGKVTVCQDYVETTHEIPSEAIRQHHRGMLNRALEALSEQSVTERLFNSITLNFKPEDLELAKKRIVDFNRAFHEEFGHNTSDTVYQLNVQLFSHTSPSRGKEK
ncbi:DUF4423 domain-containing protein [Pseudobdellovibrio sp. HCB154]|uniref:DUF4423 domain-containing protein n=1 Tax=Pseudobdellovibrio sp. HCB154 TaxID=3386277 RepID=UPI003916EEB9